MKDLLKRRFVAVFALVCVLVLALGATVFSQSTPAYADGEIIEKKPTVTFIGSAIDSDELAEPYVIELEYGTSVSDLDRSIHDAIKEHFTVDGYTPFEGYLYVMSKPLSELGNWGDIYNEDDVQYNREVTEDTTFYVAMVKIIDSVEVSVDAPLCGVETTTPSQEASWGTMWFWQEQTNKPTYAAEGEGYAADYEDWGSFWNTDETRNVPYIGTFVGDETYYAELWLTADFGYSFAVDDSGSADGYSGEAIIDGGTLVKTIYDMHSLGVVATVTAEHDWGEWTQTTAPTCTEAGEEARECTYNNEDWHTEDAAETREVEATGHDWDEWEVTKEATVDAEGEETRTCKHDASHKETRAIPKLDPIVYTNTAGDGNEWGKGSGVTSDFTFKRSVEDETTFSHFTKAQVDGKDLASGDYTAESGSVIIKLNPSFLETLAVGKHTLTAFFDDGNSADADFTIVEGEKTYTLTFNLDGGTWNGQTEPVVTPIPEGVTIVFTDDVPTKTGYTFVGWEDASGKIYKVGDTFEVTADATFTAVWEAAAKPAPKKATPSTGDAVAFGSMAALAASGLVSLLAAKATRKED